MRPSSERTTFGAVFGFVMLLAVAVLLPLGLFKWMAEAVAPDMMESLTYRLRGYMAIASGPMLQGLKGALEAIAVASVAIYLCYLLRPVGHSVLKRTGMRPRKRAGKLYLKLHPKGTRILAPLRRMQTK